MTLTLVDNFLKVPFYYQLSLLLLTHYRLVVKSQQFYLTAHLQINNMIGNNPYNIFRDRYITNKIKISGTRQRITKRRSSAWFPCFWLFRFCWRALAISPTFLPRPSVCASKTAMICRASRLDGKVCCAEYRNMGSSSSTENRFAEERSRVENVWMTERKERNPQ